MNNMNMICLPFAGGNVYSYLGYVKLAPPALNIIPLELPGRGARIREKLLKNMDEMVEDIFKQAKPYLNEKPYMIYGHSMGTFLGYLLTKRIIEEGLNPPKQLIFTGARAPSVKTLETKKHLLPKDEFIAKLIEYGGSPDEILNDASIMNFFEPILRADFEGVENYIYTESEPLDIPIYVMIGSNERTTYEEAMAWQKETKIPLEIKQFEGKHFFIFDHEKEIIAIISKLMHRELSSNILS